MARNEHDRLERKWREQAGAFKREAEKLPQGKEREALLRKASQLETACRINDWVSSPGLQPSSSRSADEGLQHYRAYFRDGDGYILWAIDLHCKDDDAAKERTSQLVDGHDLELWHRDRRIAAFKATSNRTSP
jgi:hypothetical protein